MKGRLIVEEPLRNKHRVFEDRQEAGRRLSQRLIDYKDATNAIVLAIPAGGVPVAFEIATSLNLPMDLILVRKIQIPWNTEAGFGAINPDGEVALNKELLSVLSLTEDEINQQIRKTENILRKRNDLFRGGKKAPVLEDKTVILVDDGLASGYTMLSALRFVKKRRPQKIIVAVPTGSLDTVDLLLSEVNELICLNVRTGFPYAVADAYRNWYDVTDEEVKSLVNP